MEEIERAYPYVAGIDIYYEGTQTAVTGFSRIHESVQEEDIEKYLPWYTIYEEMERDEVFLPAPQYMYPTRESVITYVKRISQSKWNGRGIIVAIHISPNSMHEYIDEVTGNLVILSPVEKILYVSSGTDMEVEKAVLQQIHNKEVSSIVNVKVGANPFTVFRSSFHKTNLEYVYFVQDSIFYADFNIRNRIFLMNFLISILFNLLILAIFSILNHSLYRKQVFFLKNRISSLNETVQLSKPLMMQNEVRALVLNRSSEKSSVLLDAYLCYDSVRVLILDYEETVAINDTAEKLQKEFLCTEKPYYVLFTTMECGEIVAVLIMSLEEQAEVLHDFFVFLEMQNQQCKIVTGALYSLTQGHIRDSYQSACEMEKYRFIFHDRRILSYEELRTERRKSSGSHLKIFEAIGRDINGGNIQNLKYHLEALKVSFLEGNYTIEYCMSTLRDLVSFLYQLINQKQLDMWIMIGYDIREYYKQIPDIDKFMVWISQVCEVLIQNMHQKQKDVDEQLKEQLIHLIEENLENGISLDILADELSMRPDILSRLFKQIMGKGYTDYVKEKKMERALELLKEDFSVKEISCRLGYSSSQYFIKVFKEVYGITPYQYKIQGGSV